MVQFQGSHAPTLGVELELQILDAKTLDLTPQSARILEKCQTHGLDRIKLETHQSILEIDSEISRSVKECNQFLTQRVTTLLPLVEELGLKLSMTGTHPLQHWPDRLISDFDRYLHLHEKYQWLFKRMNVYGLHVHVGVKSGERVIAIMNQMLPYLPLLLALSANSPFWHGNDTGVQSCRLNILESFPFAGIPPLFHSWEEFLYYYLTLHRSRAIQSFKDLYWYIRPSPTFGTLEIRICDVPASLDDTMAIVALIQCLIDKIDTSLEANPTQKFPEELHWIAPENLWSATRYGLEGTLILNTEGKQQPIREMIGNLVDELTPIATRLNCQEELLFIKTILLRGNGAMQQREIYQKTGSFQSVISHGIESLMHCMTQ